MADLAGGEATALDARVVTGRGPERSRLECAAGAWESAVDATTRARRKVAKLREQLAGAEHWLGEAIDAEQQAVAEFEAAKAEIGGIV